MLKEDHGIMRNLLVDERDQRFVLHEMLNIAELGETQLYDHVSRDLVDMSLEAAKKFAEKEFYPTMATSDREACRLENGDVQVPGCYHRLKHQYDQGKWPSTHLLRENGGQGLPMSLWAALFERFMHSAPFVWAMPKPFCASTVIERFGSEEQKEQYLKPIISGKWGPTIAANEDASGSDPSMQTTVARKHTDGSYRIKGTKAPISGGDSDLFENIVHLVLARVEGDPANETGLSLFLVPKYRINADGSLGDRNDYTVVSIERKLGFNGNPSCTINFGENGSCYGEMIGEQRQAMPIVLQALKSGYLCNGTLATGMASAAYLHALDHAKTRLQGAHIAEAQNPDAQRVPIIAHPDVRRMLLWMKSQVEGMRALLYFSGFCMDKAGAVTDSAEQETRSGLMDLLLPICRIYSADMGFRVVETAIQVHGRMGYFSDSPVQQFLRDIKPASIWEIANGVHALLYVAQTMGQRDGKDFANLLHEMGHAVAEYANVDGIQDLAEDVQARIGLLGEMGVYFSECAAAGKLLVPVTNATPFAHVVGTICVGWLLFKQSGIATVRLMEILAENSIDPQDAAMRSEFLGKNAEAAFYDGKVQSARFFIKNELTQVDGIATAIKNEDLSAMTIHDVSF
jgi:alkylation response protein AidB-like acyl-CoA dehydrogenase